MAGADREVKFIVRKEVSFFPLKGSCRETRVEITIPSEFTVARSMELTCKAGVVLKSKETCT
jgi:hypothetical protein